jgi:hypothetical protein
LTPGKPSGRSLIGPVEPVHGLPLVH